jgi:15-cis-phytoene synthase
MSKKKNMKQLFDNVSFESSKTTTHAYSTSFSLGIYCLRKQFRQPICNVYGFVRFADEIVDTFHGYNQRDLLNEFRRDTWLAIERRISLNPILNSFQQTVHEYRIEDELITRFLDSMEMDLNQQLHNSDSYKQYVLGSAEVVGLMCLRVFTQGDDVLYNKLRPAAMRLGAAFQKVNFLRDLKADTQDLGRMYFPQLQNREFTEETKREIEAEIEIDFNKAIEGLRSLPQTSRFGVYVAYVYYRALFRKIKSLPSRKIMNQRIRISNPHKMGLLAASYFRHSFRRI